MFSWLTKIDGRDRFHVLNPIWQSFIGGYTSSLPLAVSLPPNLDNFMATPKIQNSQHTTLERICSLEEVKNALFYLHPTKAQRPDGLYPIFFQSFRETTKQYSYRLLERLPKINKGVGDSIISLIPKVPNPETINQLRPISFYNTVYKIITKILVNRLRPVMDYLIAPYQSSFILGRRASDNYIIAQ